ncbi:hypothetical protein AVEN_75124-1 [Araneus ventricosus]|uniref:Uncharacterized protein n=1 Tax=Araneus ventricosus TaxID=182803 RepID=A0A4Y2RRT0_ARAVE|nr:hypothetical protein AVEN_75124-1 [Araneus ventricosus]
MPAFRHPHLPPHTVVKRQNMELRIVSGATGSFVVTGNRDPSSPRAHPHWSGGNWLLSHCYICKYTLNECCSAAPLIGGSEERSDFTLVDDFRNAAYLWLFKLCSLAGALNMARNIFSPAGETAFDVDEGL